MRNFLSFGIATALTITVFLIASCHNEADDISSREFHFSPPDTEGLIVRIENKGDNDALITLKWNEFPYTSNKEIIQSLRRMEDAFPGEPDWQKAWRFIFMKTGHGLMVTRENWLYDPVVLLNSAGMAYCGFRASALAHLWQSMGYQVRVWGLNGHVVPEICVKGRWMMLDPDLETYYILGSGEIAGVDTLCKNTALITRPVDTVNPHCSEYADKYRYSSFTAGIYASTHDNSFFDITLPSNNIYWPGLLLPAQGLLEFPVKDSTLRIHGDFGEVIGAAYLKMLVPAGWTGKFSVPLIIRSVSGTGRMRIKNNEFDIDSPEAAMIINSRKEFNTEIEITKSSSDLIFYFMINERIAKIGKENRLIITGRGASWVEAGMVDKNMSFK